MASKKKPSKAVAKALTDMKQVGDDLGLTTTMEVNGESIPFPGGERTARRTPRQTASNATHAREAVFSIFVEHLLAAVQAVLPLASTSKEDPHLTQLRFVAGTEFVTITATDGHAMGKVTVPVEDSASAELHFCLQTSYAPTLIKALSRVSPGSRSTTEVVFTVSRFRIKVQVGDGSITLPNAAEQLQFPEVEKAIPDLPPHTRTSVTEFGVNPKLLQRVMGAATHIAAEIIWRSPASPLDAIRFDVVNGVGSITATYVVMPMRLGVDQEDEDEPDAQVAFDGMEPKA